VPAGVVGTLTGAVAAPTGADVAPPDVDGVDPEAALVAPAVPVAAAVFAEGEELAAAVDFAAVVGVEVLLPPPPPHAVRMAADTRVAGMRIRSTGVPFAWTVSVVQALHWSTQA
jgi:hypothetical protein